MNLIKQIKQDYKTNSKIKLEFPDKIYEGQIICIEDNFIRLQTNTGISVISNKLLENILCYDIYNQNLEETKKDNTPNYIEKDLPKGYKDIIQSLKELKFEFPNENFVFKLKKGINRYNTDDNTYELAQHLNGLYDKYNYAIKQTEKEKQEKLSQILNVLKTLHANNYFDDDLRFNIAFINYKINNLNQAIEILKKTHNLDLKSVMNHFLSYLLFKNKEYLNATYYFANYFVAENIDIKAEDFIFFIKLLEQTRLFEAFKQVIQKNLKDKNTQKFEIIYFSLLYLININGFIDEFSEQINIYSESFDIENYIQKNLNLLLSKTTTFINPIIEKDNKNYIISPNAEIYSYSNNYGFLRFINNQKQQITAQFSLNDILDEDLKKQVNQVNFLKTIQVFCSIIDDRRRGVKAFAIQKPKDVNLIIESAQRYIDDEDFEKAYSLLEQFPDNEKALDLKNKIPKKTQTEYPKSTSETKVSSPVARYSRISTNSSVSNYRGNNYSKANIARQKKDWDTAKIYFKKAIEQNENAESAIKDLASIYAQEGNYKDSINLVEDNLKKMSNKETAFNFLSNIYTKAEEYQKSINILENLLTLPPPVNINIREKRNIEINRKKAYCYIKLKNYSNAKKLLNAILRKQPEDNITQKWLNELIEAERTGSYKKIDTFFNARDFSSLISGLSNLILKALDKKEFDGIPATAIATGNFTHETLNTIRSHIEKAGRARPRERAGYLLSEATLMQILEPENEYQLKSVLARYCNAMALSCATDNYPPDVIRNYYLEAFSLEQDWLSLDRQVGIFLASFELSGEELVIQNQKRIEIERAINLIFNTENQPTFLWDSILEMSIVNPTITANILWKIYENDKARKSAFSFLNSINVNIFDNATKGDFRTKWNEAREKRKQDFDSWSDTIKALENPTNIDALSNIIENSLKQLKTGWLQQTDSFRLESIKRDVIRTIQEYLLQTTYDEKERLFDIASASIERIIKDIESKPTRFSFEGFISLLNHINKLLKNHFENLKNASTPIISLKILGEVAVIDNKVCMQVAIRNEEKQKSSIYDIKLSLENTESCQLIGEPVFSPEVLKGGDEKIEKLLVKVSPQVVEQKVGDIKLKCSYKSRNTDDENVIISEQTINLYDEKEFELIDNVFARFANSNAVTDKSMFYGRDEFIKQIVDTFLNSKSKCIVIYGQKRSGKSSVLHHLKNALNATSEAFCISFSLGTIITELSIASFYYKILSEIKKELGILNRKGIEIPDFNNVNYEEIEKRPVIIFEEKIEDFLEKCQSIRSWKTKKFILLIDEFTYLYSSIQKGIIPGEFMHTWKSIIEKNYFNSVLIGQDVMPAFIAKFSNDFGVTEDIRLSYLKKEDAKALIEKPIWYNKKNESRYIGNAVEKIIDYTAGNPYYIQIFCARLVDYMNTNKAIRVTEVTVKEVADSLIKGNQSLSEEKEFDNLLTAGDADLEINPVPYTIEVLKQIAYSSKNLGACSLDSIKEGLACKVDIISKLDDIIQDLRRRQVISFNQGLYRIQVQLFHEWLLNH